MRKILLAGLGNVGSDYEGTRHNIGFDILDAFIEKYEGISKVDRLAVMSEVKYKGKIVICIKPTTYMNLSGRAVKYWMDKEGIGLENLLVLVDELAIPLEKLRLRPTGSHAGHNGLRSVQESLGTENYPKLRFGIGNKFLKGQQVDYVLGKWNESELPIVKFKIAKCVELIENFIQNGIELTMNQFNNLTFKL